MDAADRATDGWEPTLAAALLGAERAPPSQPGPLSALVAESDPAGALLARLAAEGAHHLAGTGLGPEALAPAEPRDVFLFFDNTDKRHAPANAATLMEMLNLVWQPDAVDRAA